MADKTIKHFIFSRFFPSQYSDYLYNVLAPSFLKKQLPLTKNMLRSLENQTNKNFELIFLMNPNYFDNPKYEFIFSTLQDLTSLPLKFIKRTDIPSLVRGVYKNYDFVIQSQTDFDDFIFKDAVADTQSKVNECDSILSYGYCKGYVYSAGELYPISRDYGGMGQIGDLQSLILKSDFAINLPFIGILVNHTKIKTIMKDFLEKNGFDFEERMFQQNKTINFYIYFIHEFSQEYLLGHSKTKGKKPLTTADITKKHLEEEFGFFYDLNSIK